MTQSPKKISPKAIKTKEVLYQTALRLFSDKGYRQTTMREIAKEAGMALGSSYYYFPSKEAIVLEFYAESQKRFAEEAQKINQKTRSLRERLKLFLISQFKNEQDFRSLASVLAKIAADPTHPLSPFSQETKSLRESSIQRFGEAIENSSTKVPKDLKPHLPYLLWLYHMGLLFFWINDNSEGQKRTYLLMEATLDIMIRLIKIAKFPIMKSLRKSVLGLFKDLLPDQTPLSKDWKEL